MQVKLNTSKRDSIKPLLTRLCEISVVDKEKGKIRFLDNSLVELERIGAALYVLLDFKPNINSIARLRIINQSLDQVAFEQNDSEGDFLKSVEENLRNFRSKKEQEYCVLLSITLKQIPFRKVDIDKSVIRIYKEYPRRFISAREEQKKQTISEKEDGRVKIVISTRTRHHQEAFDQAMGDFDVFRGILNLHINPGYHRVFGSTERKPINEIMCGKLMTIHKPDGSIADKDFYGYSTEDPDGKTAEFKVDKFEVKRILNDWFKKFNTCRDKHKQTIKKAFKQYVEAFDFRNPDLAFLRSWNALETLCATDNNEVLIKRCSSIFQGKTKEFQWPIMQALRILRNESVHQGTVQPNDQHYCFEVQNIFKHVMQMNLQYAGKFKSIEEVVQFMDWLNRHQNELERQSAILELASQLKKYNRNNQR